MPKQDTVCKTKIREDRIEMECKDGHTTHISTKCVDHDDGDGVDCTYTGKLVNATVEKMYEDPSDVLSVDWKKTKSVL